MSYWRFGAMIATSVVVMFAIKYLSTYEWSHVWYSETRTYMALMMGGAMGVIMLGFMLGMYRNRKINIAIFAGAAAVFAICRPRGCASREERRARRTRRRSRRSLRGRGSARSAPNR